MDRAAERIWEESERYLAMARDCLNPASLRPGIVRTAEDDREWLRISFLFPTLPEKSKTDLLSVRRLFLRARAQQERELAHPDECAEYSEAMADQAANQLREALPSFSDVQRQILEREFIISSARPRPGQGSSQ